MGYCAASSGNILATFRDYLPICPIFRFRNLKIRPIGCTETSVRNYHYSLRNNPEQHSSNLLSGGSVRSRIVFEADTDLSYDKPRDDDDEVTYGTHKYTAWIKLRDS